MAHHGFLAVNSVAVLALSASSGLLGDGHNIPKQPVVPAACNALGETSPISIVTSGNLFKHVMKVQFTWLIREATRLKPTFFQSDLNWLDSFWPSDLPVVGRSSPPLSSRPCKNDRTFVGSSGSSKSNWNCVLHGGRRGRIAGWVHGSFARRISVET